MSSHNPEGMRTYRASEELYRAAMAVCEARGEQLAVKIRQYLEQIVEDDRRRQARGARRHPPKDPPTD